MQDFPVVHLTEDMDTSSFECGELTLDVWLKNRALKNESLNATRTYVLCHQQKVIGYHALAAGSLRHELVSGSVKRNKPDPLPMLLLARLAVDRRYQGLGLAHRLFQDAVGRCLQVSEIAGVVAILVHAVSPAARSFYFKLGFTESQTKPMTMYIRLKDLRQLIKQ